MKTLPTALATHVAGGTTTLADLLKVTRTDGTVFAWTSAADDVTISSVLYKAAQGLNISSMEHSAGLNVDNLELTTLDDGTVFTKLDVLSGKWRNAAFVISRYNWASPADGVDVRMAGTVGEVRLHRGYVTAELRGLQQYLQQPIGSVSSKTCRARLGDSMCTKSLTSFTYAAEVSTVTSNQVFTAIFPGGSGDANYANVSLLLHGNGTNGSTTVTDNSPTPKTVTCFGNAQISTTQSKFGGASVAFDGTGDYLQCANSSDFDFGSGDFTVEGFMYTNTVSGVHAIAGYANGSASNSNYAFQLITNGASLQFQCFVGTTAYGSAIGTVTTGAWHHFALVRSGTNLLVFYNGALLLTTAIGTATINNPAGSVFQVGQIQGFYPFNGYIDDLRLTKGVARYTAAFTPSASAFPDAAVYGAWPATDGFFSEGLATWTSGANDGLVAKIKTSTAASLLTLSLPMLARVAPGDTLTLVAGCQKRLEDCSTKFSNVLNFQGEPHLPGIDEVTQ